VRFQTHAPHYSIYFLKPNFIAASFQARLRERRVRRRHAQSSHLFDRLPKAGGEPVWSRISKSLGEILHNVAEKHGKDLPQAAARTRHYRTPFSTPRERFLSPQ
jgi:hypothetical protein